LNARKLISNRSRRTPKASFLLNSDPRFTVSRGLPGWWRSTSGQREENRASRVCSTFLFSVSTIFRSSRKLFWLLLYVFTHSCCVSCAPRLLSGERTYYIGIVLFIELSNNRRKFASRRIIHLHSTNLPRESRNMFNTDSEGVKSNNDNLISRHQIYLCAF